MKRIMLLGLLWPQFSFSQELFVFTEPASNMATGSVGLRLNNVLMPKSKGNYQYNLSPEIMVGVSKKLMLHAEGYLSNNNSNFKLNGGGAYAKYRFLSKDAVQRHFRMAAYARYSYNTSPIMAQEIETAMYNSGFEGGLIATQLLHKTALSSSVSYEQALDNGRSHPVVNRLFRAVNGSLSVGRLVLPKRYKSFNQTNVNGMLELLGQYNTGLKKAYVDVAPSVQFIFNSRWRVDVAWRKQLLGSLQRMANNSFLMRLEYNFFNVF